MLFRFLFIISFILCFFECFGIIIGNLFIPYYYIGFGMLFSFALLLKPKLIFKIINQLNRTISFKLLKFFIVWIIIGIIISIFTGKFSFRGFLFSFIGGVVFSLLLPYLSVILCISRIIILRDIIKLTLITFLILYFFGVLEFIIYYFDIDFFKSIFIAFVNKYTFNYQLNSRLVHYSFGLPRISGVFLEPSYFAYFIVISSPITYLICFSKNQLFKNIVSDKVFKILSLVLMWVCLLLTQSPIFFLIFVIISFSIYFLKNNRSFFNPKVLIIINSCMLAVVLLIFLEYNLGLNCLNLNFSVENTFLNRIISTIENFKDINNLITVEDSFATRLILYVNYFIIFIKNSVFGVGYGNLTNVIYSQLYSSPLPLTPELFSRIQTGSQIGSSATILLRYLSETGIIGTLLIYSFFFNLIFKINKIFKTFIGIEKDFLIGLKLFLIIVICTSIYDSSPNSPILWVFIGIVQSMIIFQSKSQEFSSDK